MLSAAARLGLTAMATARGGFAAFFFSFRFQSKEVHFGLNLILEANSGQGLPREFLFFLFSLRRRHRWSGC